MIQMVTYYSIFVFLINLPSMITAQQPYGNSNCPVYDNSTTALGYTCNGVNTSCQSYLIYRTQPSYNTLSSIATLLSANAIEMSAINNNISQNMSLATNTQVIVPVTCSCSGRFYQANASHVVQAGDTPYTITTEIFRGLTTCNAIQFQKDSPDIINIFPDERLNIPLRCACPTTTQINDGIRYLMTFVFIKGNSMWGVASKFGANLGQTFEANELAEQDEDDIQPFTTIIVPLKNPPNGSVMDYPAYVSPPPSSPPSLPPTDENIELSSGGSSSRKWSFFGAGLAAGAVVVSIAGIVFFLMYSRKKSPAPEVGLSQEKSSLANSTPGTLSQIESLEFLESISKIASLKVYSFKDLQGATDNFSSDSLIEGWVYKGNLNGDEVAIKKMDGDVSKEINVLNKINHFNLIKLLGVCFVDGVWYFVYEYAGNGTLSDWIFYQDNPRKQSLSWGKRMQVASDVATGLNYLHSYTSPPLVHKDINTRNIFITQEYRAKIAKFGLSRPVRGNDGQYTLTKHIEGTKGYLAPEYLENGVVSPMLDVYAFGVLLLELVTGKDVARLYEGVKVELSEILGPMLSAADQDWSLSVKDFIDSSLEGDYPDEIVYTMIMLIERCLSKQPGNRPSMDEVVQIVSKALTTSLVWVSTTSAC